MRIQRGELGTFVARFRVREGSCIEGYAMGRQRMPPPDLGRRIVNQDEIQEEGHWADHDASPDELRIYLAELHALLRSTSSLTFDEMSDLDAERATDAEAPLEVLRERVGRSYELLGDAYCRKAGRFSHTYDCPISAAPAFRPQACNCNALGDEYPLSNEH